MNGPKALWKGSSTIKDFNNHSSGKDWKTLRSAVGKQTTPRNVQSYCGGFNTIFGHFMDHIGTARGEDGLMGDIVIPLKLLFIESE